MEKIPTLFVRDPEDMRRLTREIHPDCKWVIDGEGVATRKYDGICVMFDDTRWWARREVKLGKPAPANFRPISTDEATGKTVGWEPIEQSAFARWHAEVIDRRFAEREPGVDPFPPGTYELVGPKINRNPESVERHELWAHATAQRIVAPRDYDRLAEFLASFEGEGIVWHHPDGRTAKIKRRDFPTTGEETDHA